MESSSSTNLHMVEVVSCIQVNAFGLLVDGHDSQTDIQRAVELPSLDLKQPQDGLTVTL